MNDHNLEATQLRDNRWVVRPLGQLGTCGVYPYPWTVCYVTASSEKAAIEKAVRMLKKMKK